MIDRIDIVRNAISFAENGFHVFPLLARLRNERNKSGTPIGWNHNKPEHPLSIPSTIDTHKIKGWIDKYEDLIGYGINPRGRRSIILDIDVKDGAQGRESFKKLQQRYNLTLSTLVVRTKSGGAHVYYSYEGVPPGYYVKGLTSPTIGDLKLSGIDIRSDNSFVVGPTDKGLYKIIQNNPLSALPEELINYLPLAPTHHEETLKVDVNEASGLIYNDHSFKGVIPDSIPVGERDDTLIRLIGSWARKFPKEMTIQLTKLAIDNCQKTGSDDPTIQEYLPKIESTYSKIDFAPITPDRLRWMEDHFVYVRMHNALYNQAEPPHLAIMPMNMAKEFYRNWLIFEEGQRSTKKVYLFQRWMESPNRINADSYGYYPKGKQYLWCDVQQCQIVNTYSEPFSKNFEPDGKDYSEYVDKFYELMSLLWGEHTEFMLDWCAHMVQHPDVKLSFAPVLISPVRGVGKDLMFDIISNVVGPWNAARTSVGNVVDKFSPYALGKHLVLINEAVTDPRDRKSFMQQKNTLEELKGKITDNVQEVEPKFQQRISVKSFINYIVFSNNKYNAVPVEDEDRRFFVHVTNAKRYDRRWYDMLWEMARVSEGERSRQITYFLRQWLAKREITLVKRGDVARFTEAKASMIDLGKTNEQVQLDEAIMNQYSVFRSDLITYELWEWFCQHKLTSGFKLSSAAIRELFRKYTEPATAPGQGRARQIRAMAPERTVNGTMFPAEVKKSAIYTVRNHGKYGDTSAQILRRWLDRSFEATRFNYKEPESDEVQTGES